MEIGNNNINLENAGVINLDFAIPKESQIGKSGSLNISATKSIRTKTSSENKKAIKYSPKACDSGFYEKIIEKYNLYKISSMLLPYLIFHKPTATNFEIINIKKLKAGDSYFISCLLFLEYIHWKYSSVSRDLSKSKIYVSSSSPVSYFQKKEIPDPGVFSLQLPTTNPVSRLLHLRNEISNEDWKIGTISQKTDFLTEKLQYVRKSSIITLNKYEEEGNSKKIAFLVRKRHYGQKSNELTLDKYESSENDQKIGFPVRQLHHGQKSSIFTLNKSKEADMGKNVQHKAPLPQKNTTIEFADLKHKNAAMGQAVVDHSKNDIEDRQDTVLRKTGRHISKEISTNFEKGEPGYTSNDYIRTLSKKSNTSVSSISPGEINTIADKVYRLLESRLLMEKERRGLR